MHFETQCDTISINDALARMPRGLIVACIGMNDSSIMDLLQVQNPLASQVLAPYVDSSCDSMVWFYFWRRRPCLKISYHLYDSNTRMSVPWSKIPKNRTLFLEWKVGVGWT